MWNRFFFILFLSATVSKAQVGLNTKKLDFGTQQTGALDSLKLTLTSSSNTQSEAIIKIDSKVFFVKDSILTLTTTTKDIWVYFLPKHNINYHSFLLMRKTNEVSDIAIELIGSGTYNEPYYSATQNLSEEALKTSLQSIISQGQIALGYNGARDKMFMEIDNKKVNGQGASVNTLECVYTGRLVTGYTSRSDAQTSGNLNTEHTWPQSLFNSNNPMVCDLNHLFVTDETANGKRSNYPFAIVTNPSWENGGSKYGSSTFEPRDEHKGRVARAMMYFIVRYQGKENITPSFFTSQESTFRKWHEQFPPNSIDSKRNDDVEDAQGNRNPFIDHPEFLERITSLSSTSVAPIKRSLVLVKNSLNLGSSIIQLQKNDSIVSYKILLHNTGNQTISISNAIFKKSDTVKVSYFPTSIAPDMLDTIIIVAHIPYSNLPFTAILNDTLSITTNGTDNTILNIPFEQEINRPLWERVKESSLTNTFQLYPNPSNSEFVISSKDTKPFDFYIRNLQGEILIISKKNMSNSLVNTADLASGLYFIQLSSEAGSIIKKVIINHN